MASSNAIWNEYMSLSRVHYSADDFYNQSFIDRINKAQRDIDNLVSERNDISSKRQQAQDAYDTFSGNMRNYSSMLDESEDKYGVQTSMENYEKAKNAVLATEQALDALPSSINANSNVVMSQSRRELAYNVAANKWGKTMETRQQATDVNKEVWDRARQNANAYAEQLYGEQLSTQESLSLQWAEKSSQYQQAVERIQSAESLKWNIQSDYRDWQWGQAEIQNAYARARAEDAFNRYMVQLKYEQTARMEQYMRESAQRELERQQRERERKERLAQQLVNNHFKYQEQRNIAQAYDAGGILGRLMYVLSH